MRTITATTSRLKFLTGVRRHETYLGRTYCTFFLVLHSRDGELHASAIQSITTGYSPHPLFLARVGVGIMASKLRDMNPLGCTVQRQDQRS